jgi:hypothetical protein
MSKADAGSIRLIDILDEPRDDTVPTFSVEDRARDVAETVGDDGVSRWELKNILPRNRAAWRYAFPIMFGSRAVPLVRGYSHRAARAWSARRFMQRQMRQMGQHIRVLQARRRDTLGRMERDRAFGVRVENRAAAKVMDIQPREDYSSPTIY